MVQIKRTIKIGTYVLGLSLMFAGNSLAAQDFLSPIEQTNPPIGHYEFCKINQDECKVIGNDQGPMALSRKSWATLISVNNKINSDIKPLTDMQINGVEELWSFPTTVGDCEDYVLLKRRELMKQGFSAADLLITVVIQPNGAGHAVLTVRTDYGDFILDNMRDNVVLWHESGYRFIKRQSSVHAGAWMRLGDGKSPATASFN